ncbi:MAG: ABC-F family ATP-binding cassette domain-containing protein [Bacilli bacterium]|nr:ABC-F family ATP-binding cassette domain-containing protein [Bacilli bacterium]
MKAINLKLSLGNEVIYDDASFELKRDAHTGIVGVNGAGKTTLFKIILKELELDGGNLILDDSRIGYLPQEIDLENYDMSVLEYIYSARPIKKLHRELDHIYEELAIGDSKEEKRLLKKASKIQSTLDTLNEYTADDELLSLLSFMNIDDELLERNIKELSGGQKSKVAFAHLLFSNAETLLLDEPTNHLDKTTKEFVTTFLKNYHGSLLVISHDVDFLNSIVDNILFIDKITHKIKVYEGSYDDFKKKYAKEKAQKESRIIEEERKIKKLEAIVKKAEQASRTNHNLKRLGASRKIQLEKCLNELEMRDKVYNRVKLKIKPNREIGKIPLEVNGLTFRYPNSDYLYKDLSFTLTKNEKFLIVGENGIGKSTLLKLLVDKLNPLSGSITFNSKADISYYAQELEILDGNKSILDNVKTSSYTELETRKLLGNFLFYKDDVFKKVEILSPGEKARVALCKILISRPNFIILDEPTNHFDPETQSIIGENFKEYEGTLILVSHNPSFVEEIGITRMLVLPDGKVIDYSRELLHYYYYLNTDIM